MSKPTAVEWLEAELKKLPMVNVIEVFQKAEEMERIHIIYAYDDGANERHNDPVTGEDYYNETFKTE